MTKTLAYGLNFNDSHRFEAPAAKQTRHFTGVSIIEGGVARR